MLTLQIHFDKEEAKKELSQAYNKYLCGSEPENEKLKKEATDIVMKHISVGLE